MKQTNQFNKEWQNFLIKSSYCAKIILNNKQAEKFAYYAAELVKWNKKINITAITSPIDIAVKHFIDSIIILPILKNNISLLDIGAGGGFPGIPIKIMRQDIKISLIESSNKKVSFLKNIIRILELTNIKAYDIRAQVAKDITDFSYNFDVVACRSFTSFSRFLKIASFFIKKNGIIIAFKGKNWKAEFKEAISLYNDFNFNTYEYSLPVLNHKRAIIVAEKKNENLLIKSPANNTGIPRLTQIKFI